MNFYAIIADKENVTLGVRNRIRTVLSTAF